MRSPTLSIDSPPFEIVQFRPYQAYVVASDLRTIRSRTTGNTSSARAILHTLNWSVFRRALVLNKNNPILPYVTYTRYYEFSNVNNWEKIDHTNVENRARVHEDQKTHARMQHSLIWPLGLGYIFSVNPHGTEQCSEHRNVRNVPTPSEQCSGPT